jgi:LytR cell envelope-related transcriptional attenuator
VSSLTPTRRKHRGNGRLVVVVVIILALLGAGGWYYLTKVRTTSTATPQASCSHSPGATTQTLSFPLPSQITVNVYNATNRSGLARATSGLLVARGFHPGAVANDPLNQTIAGTAQVRYGTAVVAARAAMVVAAQVPGAVLVRQTRTGTTVDLVIGNAFSVLATPAHAAAVLAAERHVHATASASARPSGC